MELPSEAEWEYACRAGTTTPFHFGSRLNGDLANSDGNYPYGTDVKGVSRRETSDVGSYPANPWGLHEVHGNVWEWCRDYYGPYDKVQAVPDPIQLTRQADDRRVLRGGSWGDAAEHCRAAIRDWYQPHIQNKHLGVRVAFRLN